MEMLRTLHAISLSLLCIGLFVGCSAPSAAPAKALDPLAGQYTIKGGGSAMAATKRLTDSFAKAHAGVTFDLEDVGSDGGIALVAEGAVDLGMISRDVKPSEAGQVETVSIGITASGFLVRTDNPVTNLTRAQLRDIFSGTVTDWAQVGGQPGPISVFIREPESSTRLAFEAFVFHGKPTLSPNAVEVYEKDPMFNALRGLRGGIGMATLDASTLGDSSVRFVGIDGVPATIETVKSGSYPIRRPLYITYRPNTLKPATQAFIDYLRGPDGQQLINSR
jgi:phosphate transport system substrate-binding protein